jgi:hypothetical protein
MSEDKYKQVRTTAERTEGVQPRSRIPFGVPRTKMAVPHQIEGFCLRWVNDVPGRIFQAQQGGYEFVTTSEMNMQVTTVTDVNKALGDKIAILVGTQKSGEPMFAYLMKIKEEYRQEDEAALAAVANRNDQQIRNGNAGGVNSEEFYVPKHSPIKMQTKKTF